MAVLRRISRLFLADVHAVLDAMEEPQAVVRQAIRDMAVELTALEQRCQARRDDIRHAERSEHHYQDQLAALEEELTLSLNAQREDLARDVVRRRLQLQQLLQVVRQQLQEHRHQLDQELAHFSDCQRRMQDVRQQAELWTQSHSEASTCSTDDVTGRSVPTVSEEDVELALLRELQQRGAS